MKVWGRENRVDLSTSPIHVSVYSFFLSLPCPSSLFPSTRPLPPFQPPIFLSVSMNAKEGSESTERSTA